VQVLSAFQNPDRILAGNEGEQMAVKELSDGVKLINVYPEFERARVMVSSSPPLLQPKVNGRIDAGKHGPSSN